MSIPVSLSQLGVAIEERGSAAYLLTVSHDGRPHAVHSSVGWDGDVLAVEVGARSAANAAARPAAVSLLYPARTADDYSLIIDGSAAPAALARRHALRITPTRAVLHRPAATPDPTSTCADDCIPLLPETGRENP